MDRRYIERWLETAPTKGAKRTWFLAIKPFLMWAVESVHLIEADPINGIKVKAKESEGHATWSNEQVEQFRAHHPLGSKPRLALELLINVASRRGDGISLGRQHVKNGWLVFTQEKNRRRKPVKVEMPIPVPLLTALEACPSAPDSLMFLTNEWGRPFTKRASTHGSASRSPQPDCPTPACRTACARRAVASWLRATAPRTRLAPSAGTRRCVRSNATPRLPTGSGWRHGHKPRSRPRTSNSD
jgi:hypothetical protein